MSKVASQKSLQTSLHKNLPCKGVKWEAGPLGIGPGLFDIKHRILTRERGVFKSLQNFIYKHTADSKNVERY
jgi:hypothetical protein